MASFVEFPPSGSRRRLPLWQEWLCFVDSLLHVNPIVRLTTDPKPGRSKLMQLWLFASMTTGQQPTVLEWVSSRIYPSQPCVSTCHRAVNYSTSVGIGERTGSG